MRLIHNVFTLRVNFFIGKYCMFLNKNYKILSVLVFSFLVFSCLHFSYCENVIKDNSGIPIPFVSNSDTAIVPLSRSNEPWWINRHKEKLNVIFNQKIIFIGDSITAQWEGTEAWTVLKNKFNNRITNLGFGGDCTENVIWRLENGEFPSGINPEYVSLMIGTNNNQVPKSIAAGIGKIIQIIHANAPSAKIILFSILPRNDWNGGMEKTRSINEIIKNYNGCLNVYYYDLGIYYLNNNGTLKEELFAEDKLHLAPQGYEVWKEKLLTIIK